MLVSDVALNQKRNRVNFVRLTSLFFGAAAAYEEWVHLKNIIAKVFVQSAHQ